MYIFHRLPRTVYLQRVKKKETEREKEAYLFIGVRKEYGCIEVERQDGGKAESSPPFTEDCLRELDAMVVQGCGRSEQMPCLWLDAAQCLDHGKGAWARPAGCN